MKKLTPLGTKTAILVTEDRLEILPPPHRRYEACYGTHKRHKSFICEMAAINVMCRNIYKGKNETQKM